MSNFNVQALISRADAVVLKNIALAMGVSRSVLIKAILVRFLREYFKGDFYSIKEDLGL